MAKKNFKGGLDSLIENSLGIKKSRKGEMKGNPVDLIKPEQTDDNDEVLAKPRTPQKPVQVAAPNNTATTTTPAAPKNDAPTAPKADAPAPTKPETDAPAPAAATDNNKVSENKAADNPHTPPQAADNSPKADSIETKDETEALSFEDTPDDYDDNDDVVVTPSAPKQVVTMNLDATDDDDAKIAYMKEVIADLRHELFLWRNGTINVQTFNATLHTHGLKYNPENNEIEEFDTI